MKTSSAFSNFCGLIRFGKVRVYSIAAGLAFEKMRMLVNLMREALMGAEVSKNATLFSAGA